MRILYGNTPRIYRNTNALTSCSSLPNCKCKIFVTNCGHTKCLSWNIKYFLSCWANSTRITWCLCVLKAGTKHTYPPLKTRKLALLFSWRTARALCQTAGVASALLLPREESRQDSPRPSIHSVLQIRFGLGSSAQLLCFCACMCAYAWMLPICAKCSAAAYWVSNECASWVESICGLWEGLGRQHKEVHMQYDFGRPFCDSTALCRSDSVKMLF